MKRSPMRRGGPLKRGGSLKRRTPLRQMIQKRSKQQRLRRVMVQEELGKRELCEAGARITHAGHDARCNGLAIELHEPLTRARGGSILDPTNTVAICRSCHDWIHANPAAATQLGLLQSTNSGTDRG